MEPFLNAFWLLIALAAFALWRVHWAHVPRGPRPAACRELVGLATALLLLFPVISLTDDLHAELVLAEDSNLSKRNLRSWHSDTLHSNAGGAVSHPGVAVLPQPLFFAPLAVAGITIAQNFSCVIFCVGPSSGRAPPFCSLQNS